MEFIYGIKYEDNIDPSAVFLFGAGKYKTIIETAWEVVPLHPQIPWEKKILPLKITASVKLCSTNFEQGFEWGWNLAFDSSALFS